mgnify:CR=1 FL=1
MFSPSPHLQNTKILGDDRTANTERFGRIQNTIVLNIINKFEIAWAVIGAAKFLVLRYNNEYANESISNIVNNLSGGLPK